jgi:hypothetical protein
MALQRKPNPRILLGIWLAMLAYPLAATASFTTTLTAAQIQGALQSYFPAREYSLSARVSLHDPQVRLSNGAEALEVAIPVSADISGAGQKHGRAVLSVGLGYKAMSGELFLDKPQLRQFDMPQVSAALKQELATTVFIIAERTLPLVRIYTVHEKDLNHSLSKSALKSMLIKDGQVAVEFGFE